MRNKFIIFIGVLLLSSFPINNFAQKSFGINEISVAATETQYGLPFISVLPINPGIEVEASFVDIQKNNGLHQIGANLGYFYHSQLANAFYLKSTYSYQQQIKQVIGLDFGANIGYFQAFYPGESFMFDQQKGTYVSNKFNAYPAFSVGMNVGISFIKPAKIQPY